MMKWLKENPKYREKLEDVGVVYKKIVQGKPMIKVAETLDAIICDGMEIRMDKQRMDTHFNVTEFLRGHGLCV